MYACHQGSGLKGETGYEYDDGWQRLETTEDEAFVPAYSTFGKEGGRGRNLKIGPMRLSLTDDPGT